MAVGLLTWIMIISSWSLGERAQEISGTMNAKTANSVNTGLRVSGRFVRDLLMFKSISFQTDSAATFGHFVVQMATYSPRLLGLTADLYQISTAKPSGDRHTRENSSDEHDKEGMADEAHDGSKYFKSAQW